MAISPARKIAYEVLWRVEAEGAYASDLLHTELAADLKAADAALATELTFGVLRRRRLLDFLLERHLKKPVARLDLPVALALRLGVYQLRFLERIPVRAAVNESVELVKRAKKSSAASLVNAVLRRMSTKVAEEPLDKLLPVNLAPADRLGILHSHPTWMVERWINRMGEARTLQLLEANNQPPRLSCTVDVGGHGEELSREEIFRALEKSGIRVEPGRFLKEAISTSGGSPARTEAFRKGWISIQDEASQTIPLLLGVEAGDRVLDLCAAPGGKTAPLVRAAGKKGFVVAADRHAHRLRAMRAQFKRLNLEQAQMVELDATRPLPFREIFNRILVDAPCSGSGTLARHPEIRWRLRPERLSEFHDLQVGILASALKRLAPGGRLVYSTCSLEPEENEEVVEEALRDTSSVTRVTSEAASRTIGKHLAPGIEARRLFDSDGQFRTVPGEQPTDGFFAAILQKG